MKKQSSGHGAAGAMGITAMMLRRQKDSNGSSKLEKAKTALNRRLTQNVSSTAQAEILKLKRRLTIVNGANSSQYSRSNMKSVTGYNDDDTDSDLDLPKAQIIVKPVLKDNEFLKMYQMKNANTHESDREKANCLVQNLTFSRSIRRAHPFFNRKAKVEPEI